MKKGIAAVAVFLICFGGNLAFAEGLSVGDSFVSVSLGMANPQGSSYPFDGAKLEWADSGVNVGIQLAELETSFFAFQVETNYNSFGSATNQFGVLSVKNEMTQFNVLFGGRLYLNSNENVRLYIPLGAGPSFAHGKKKLSVGGEVANFSARSSNFAYFIGVGAEIDLGPQKNWALGAEIRYNRFRFDNKQYDAEEYVGPLSAEYLQYVSILMRVSFKLPNI